MLTSENMHPYCVLTVLGDRFETQLWVLPPPILLIYLLKKTLIKFLYSCFFPEGEFYHIIKNSYIFWQWDIGIKVKSLLNS